MKTDDFSIRQDEQGVYHLQGALTGYQVEKLKESLEHSVEKSAHIHLCLTETAFIDIAALQLLVLFKKSLRGTRRMSISGISRNVESILQVTGLKATLLD